MSGQAYIREVELRFKNPDSADLLSDNVYFSDGSRAGLRIAFNVQKTIGAVPNQSTVDIYNLSRESRQTLAEDLKTVILNVGHRGQEKVKLSTGGILNAIPSREGADIKTTVSFLDGYTSIVKSTIQRTIGKRITLKQLVTEIASGLDGVRVDPARIRLSGDKIGGRGRVLNGTCYDELNKLAREYGFTWSIQDGLFQAIDDGQSFGRVVEISAFNRNLYSASPIINGPGQQSIGVEIVAFLDPTLLPGDQIKLVSQVNPQLNNIYRIDDISFNGDTFSNTFEMRIRAYRRFGTILEQAQ